MRSTVRFILAMAFGTGLTTLATAQSAALKYGAIVN